MEGNEAQAEETAAETVTVAEVVETGSDAELDQAAATWEAEQAQEVTTQAEETVPERTEAATETVEATGEEEVAKVEEVTPPAKEEQTEGEKLAHEENSRLGRKVASMGGQMEQLQASIEQLIAAQNPATAEAEEEFFELPTTKAEFEQMVSNAETKRTTDADENQKTYTKNYLQSTDKIGELEDAASHKEVMEELSKNGGEFNIRHTNDANADAMRNYYQAKAHLLQGKVTTLSAPKPKENPLQGKPASGALGVGSPEKKAGKAVKPIQLSDEAKEFLEDSKRQGHSLSQEEVLKALSKTQGRPAHV